MSVAGKKVTLRSLNGALFEMDEMAARQSTTIGHMIDEGCADTAITFPNLTGSVLSSVVRYCRKHATSPPEPAKDLDSWDTKFVKGFDMDALYHVLIASSYLDVMGLQDLICKTVADKIRGKMPEEIRTEFNIKNDFTEEQEAAIVAENPWAFNPLDPKEKMPEEMVTEFTIKNESSTEEEDESTEERDAEDEDEDEDEDGL